MDAAPGKPFRHGRMISTRCGSMCILQLRGSVPPAFLFYPDHDCHPRHPRPYPLRLGQSRQPALPGLPRRGMGQTLP
ncbi:DNA-3-methyladenine glycosylase I domain protein [Collimonas fungivorans]|uniref:DNA-3-methyladenine glycosylase I domain protein n=1 Tax=Collimonas fungivorans TaxID=158899 RepID=A0A127PIQ7_9BURK|nr:DNA-3-methyladenine glycosylase I domain protein [Collimonas fungivorans]